MNRAHSVFYTENLCSIFHYFLLQNSKNDVHRRIYQNMERKRSYVSNMEEGIRRAQEGNYAFIGETVSLDLTAARYCKMTLSQEVIGMRAYSIALPLGKSPGSSIRIFCHML